MNQESFSIAGASTIIGERLMELLIKPLIVALGISPTPKQTAFIALVITAVINVALTYMITGEVTSMTYALGLTSGGLANGYHQVVTNRSNANDNTQ